MSQPSSLAFQFALLKFNMLVTDLLLHIHPLNLNQINSLQLHPRLISKIIPSLSPSLTKTRSQNSIVFVLFSDSLMKKYHFTYCLLQAGSWD